MYQRVLNPPSQLKVLADFAGSLVKEIFSSTLYWTFTMCLFYIRWNFERNFLRTVRAYPEDVRSQEYTLCIGCSMSDE